MMLLKINEGQDFRRVTGVQSTSFYQRAYALYDGSGAKMLSVFQIWQLDRLMLRLLKAVSLALEDGTDYR